MPHVRSKMAGSERIFTETFVHSVGCLFGFFKGLLWKRGFNMYKINNKYFNVLYMSVVRDYL